jgi:ATP synthase protein I
MTRHVGNHRRTDVRQALRRDLVRHARREPGQATFWRSLGVLGTIGWSIGLATGGGTLLGRSLDVQWHTGIRWTLSLLLLGVVLGSVVAWHQVGRLRH